MWSPEKCTLGQVYRRSEVLGRKGKVGGGVVKSGGGIVKAYLKLGNKNEAGKVWFPCGCTCVIFWLLVFEYGVSLFYECCHAFFTV